MKIAFRLNGEETTVEIEPRQTLAEVLTRKLRLTGTKVSCEAEVCGSARFWWTASRQFLYVPGL